MTKTFRGGVHPPENKWTRDAPIVACDLPDRVTVLMAQHIGAPCTPEVKKGDRVLTGQRIGEPRGFVSAPVHATVTGTVAAVETCPSPVTGERTPAVVIERDGDDEWAEGANVPQDTEGLDADAIRKCIFEAGLVGLGGATFPTHVKLSPPPDKPIDTVILNGAECEPFLTCDHRLMVEEPDKVMDGFRLIMRALNCTNGIVAVESNKPECAEAMRKSAEGDGSIRVEMPAVKYPQGAEHQLIKALLDREVPWRGDLPMAVGCVVQNVATAYAVYEAVSLRKPLIERVTTVTGDGVDRPGNFRVRIGAPLRQLLELAELRPEAKKLILGGPMMGIAQRSPDVPVAKGTSGVLVLTDGSVRAPGPCIRCGRCVRACPYGLTPATISRAIENGDLDLAMEWNVLECKECGCCTYVCPARRPIVHQVKFAKSELLKKKREREMAEKTLE